MEGWQIDLKYEEYLIREYEENAVFSSKYGNSDFTTWTEKHCLDKATWILEHWEELNEN